MRVKDMEWPKMKFIFPNKIEEPSTTIVWLELSTCFWKRIRSIVIAREWTKWRLLCSIALLIRIVSTFGELLRVMLSFAFRRLWRRYPSCPFRAFLMGRSILWGSRNCSRRLIYDFTRNCRKRKGRSTVWGFSASDGSAVSSSTSMISTNLWFSGTVSWRLSSKNNPLQSVSTTSFCP